jgi:hypothetical protein
MHKRAYSVHRRFQTACPGTSQVHRTSRGLAAGIGTAAILMLPAPMSPAVAQRLHVNDHWDNCAIVIAPALTQEAWREFVGEVGLVVYFRPLTHAKPLGRGHVEVAAVNWSTRVDDAKSAWNDTFSHPDSTHWLYDGDALPIPGLLVRAGVTSRMDAGLYVTKAPGSNYGMLGGHLQYNLLNDTARKLAAAARVSAVRLLGPDDVSATVYGADLLVSRDVGVVSPYVLASGYLSRGHEHTSKVDLKSESVFGAQASVGVEVRVAGMRLGAEYNVARVTGYSFKVGYGI